MMERYIVLVLMSNDKRPSPAGLTTCPVADHIAMPDVEGDTYAVRIYAVPTVVIMGPESTKRYVLV
jgi:hypothetical protein